MLHRVRSHGFPHISQIAATLISLAVLTKARYENAAVVWSVMAVRPDEINGVERFPHSVPTRVNLLRYTHNRTPSILIETRV